MATVSSIAQRARAQVRRGSRRRRRVSRRYTSAAVSLLMGEVKLGIGLLVLYAVTSVVRHILEPKLIGEGLGLHPLLSLGAMYAGLRLFGVWGMILAPLVAAGVKSAVGP